MIFMSTDIRDAILANVRDDNMETLCCDRLECKQTKSLFRECSTGLVECVCDPLDAHTRVWVVSIFYLQSYHRYVIVKCLVSDSVIHHIETHILTIQDL